jgi:hypothetical protein
VFGLGYIAVTVTLTVSIFQTMLMLLLSRSLALVGTVDFTKVTANRCYCIGYI